MITSCIHIGGEKAAIVDGVIPVDPAVDSDVKPLGPKDWAADDVGSWCPANAHSNDEDAWPSDGSGILSLDGDLAMTSLVAVGGRLRVL